MGNSIEIKANFKKLAVASDKVELNFVLVPSYAFTLPVLSEMVGASVFVTLDDTQMSMQVEETAEPDELVQDQPQLPEAADVIEVDADDAGEW